MSVESNASQYVIREIILQKINAKGIQKNMKKFFTDNKYSYIFASLIFMICFGITYKQSFIQGSDFFIHNYEALDISNFIEFKITYPIYHILVLIFYKIGEVLFPTSVLLEVASATVMGLIAIIVYLFTCKIMGQYNAKKPELLSFVVCTASAIWCPFYNIHIYLGQGSPNTWHSPTNIIVKPFAILVFFRVSNLLNKIKIGKKISINEFFEISILLVLSNLAKPNFYQGFIPALFLYVVFMVIQTGLKSIKYYLALGLSIVPATILIVFQLFSNFFTGGGTSGEGIGIGWFLVPKLYTPSIIISLMLLLCFPICFTIIYGKYLKRIDLKLAWIYFVVSYLEYGLLYEKGTRFSHGNFGWAYLLSSFILFIITTGLFFSKFDFRKKKDKILLGVWLLHGASGIIYINILLLIPNLWLF